MSRATFVTLIVLGACAGGGTEPTPQPPKTNAVTRVVIAPKSALLFLGGRFAIKDVAVATTTGGVPVPGARLTPTVTSVTGPSIALRNDSIIAPAGEAHGRVKISATTLAAVTTTDPSDSLFLNVVTDLRTYTWSAAWSCRAHPAGALYKGQPYDSIQYHGGRTTISYSQPQTPMENFADNGLGRIDWRGEAVVWRTGSVLARDTLAFSPVLWIHHQLPGAAYVNFPVGFPGSWSLAQISDAPRTYQLTQPPCANDQVAAGAFMLVAQ